MDQAANTQEVLEDQPQGDGQQQHADFAVLPSVTTDAKDEGEGYYRITYSKVNDMVAGRYAIKSDSPLPEFDTIFCTAFAVENKKIQDDDTQYYCLIFDKSACLRLYTINALKGKTIPFCITPIAAEVVYCSKFKEQRMVVVLPKPRGVKLSSYITQYGPCHEHFITDSIVAPICNVIRAFTELGLLHGYIHPDNIYIDEAQSIMLGDCISTSAGFLQPAIYEPVERAVVIPIAKGEMDKTADYYALGMLCFYLLIGKIAVSEITDPELLQQMRIERGTFNVVAVDVALPTRMADLLRGLLNDRKNERWKIRQITDWLKGRRYNLLSPAGNVEASRYLEFNERQHFNCRSLVYDLCRNWDAAKKFLMEDKLIKWIERSVSSPEMAEKLRQVRKLAEHAKAMVDEDELVARTIFILDPDGPVRLKEFVVNLDGMASLLSYAYSKGRKDYLQYVAKVINGKLPAAWAEAKGDIKHLGNNNIVWILDKIQPLLTEKAFGFGLERCLYDMNPHLPCLGLEVAEDYVVSLPMLMHSLEKHLKNKEGELLDRHTAAFITQRLDMQAPIRIKISSYYKEIEKHKEMQVLAMLAMAQKASRIKKLNNICKIMQERLKDVIAFYKGRSLRKEITTRLEELAENGDLMAIYKLMADPIYARRDYLGFTHAARRYAEFDYKILQYRNKKVVSEIGYKYGLQLSVILSYVICGLVITIIVLRVM